MSEDDDYFDDDVPDRKVEQYKEGNHKKGYDRTQAAIDRRNAIKKIIKDRGFVGICELKRILASDYNINVGDYHTLYKDLANIEAIKEEELVPLNNKMIARCESYLEELEQIAEQSKGMYKARMIRMYLVSVKDMAKILQLMKEDKSLHVSSPSSKQRKEYTSIMFED